MEFLLVRQNTIYMQSNMNEKTITVYSLEGVSVDILKINEENEVSVKAISTKKVKQHLSEKGYGKNSNRVIF